MEPNVFVPEVISLDKLSLWDHPGSDGLAPLDSCQKDSFLELASIASNRSLVKEVPLTEPVNILNEVSVKGVVVPGSTEHVLSQGFAMLNMGREKIETAQKFYNWFSLVEKEMAKMEAETYVEHVNTLRSYRDHCQHIIDGVNSALESLKKLRREYVFVSTKTNALHEACEHLLADQTVLMNRAESIHENLEYFSELERINSKLAAPSLQVTGESFNALLIKMDDCLDFMQAHPSYKESAEYIEKYQSCLKNALGMMKTYIIKSLESTTQSILIRKVENTAGVATADDAFTLYYGKFRTNAPRIKGLMEQIEQRVKRNDQYQHLLSDIHHCYFSQRRMLLEPSVISAMTDLVNVNKQDHCALLRSGCAFMVHVCEDEHQLYGHFFSSQSSMLHDVLLQLCGNLYDVFRPLIIHVNHLETLAELCTILKTEMIDDHVQNNPEQLQAFHTVSLQMLEDVQERLVFRVNIYVRDDIRGYKPSPGDLAYPEKLEMMEEIAQELKQSKPIQKGVFTEIQLSEDSEANDKKLSDGMDEGPGSKIGKDLKFQTSPADMHGMWYPTVRRVLVCLSKLYRCIDKTIFQGLSQEALEACVRSLVSASNAIRTSSSRKPAGNVAQPGAGKVIDAQLFLIKHLLILREQIAPFHAEFAIKETQLDFSRTKDAAFRFVWEPKSIPNILRVNSQNSLVQFVYEGAPEVKEFYIDSKKDVDRQLKVVCEEFIQHQTSVFCNPVSAFLEKAKKFLEMSNEDGVSKSSLRQEAFATPEVLHELMVKVYKDMKGHVKKTGGSMALYLANKETENILFKPIKLNIQHIFQQLHNVLLENYTEEDRAIIGAPSLDQIGLLLSTALKK